MIRQFLKKFLDIILYPIRYNFVHFIMLFWVSSASQIFSQLLMHDVMRTLFVWGFVIAYIGSAVISVASPKWLRRLVAIIIYTLLSISSLIDISIYATLKTIWNEEFPAVLAGTNLDEAFEFIEFYFGWNSILWIIGFMLSIALILLILRRFWTGDRISDRVKNWVSYIFFGLTLASAAFLLYVPNTKAFNITIFGKIRFFKYFYIKPPEIESSALTVIRNNKDDAFPIFVIIGESHSRSHSQMYGYDKPTMPHLTSLISDRFVVFKNIDAPATYTEGSIRRIMTTSDYSDLEWNKSNTVIQLMKKAGYHTRWLSNQSCRGLTDNYLNRFANLCDEAKWSGDLNCVYFIDQYNSFDENLIGLLDESNIKINSKEFVVIHFIGSHVSFDRRFPKSFKSFDSGLYDRIPQYQRKQMASYDTSIRYTDYVLNELFKRIEKTGGLAFYFSDHGLDFYNTNPDKCGHANNNDPLSVKYGKQIPFFVYISESFAKDHPELVERIHKASSRPGNTDQLFFTLMDVLDATSPQWPKAAEHSLFRAD